MRKFYIMNNIGSTKYIINYHDGIKKHKDGSPFYDILCFKNKTSLKNAVRAFKFHGAQEEK